MVKNTLGKTWRSYQIRTSLFCALCVFVYTAALLTSTTSRSSGEIHYIDSFPKSSFLSSLAVNYEYIGTMFSRVLSSAVPTDDHAAAATSHFSLFGGMTSLDVFIGTMSVIIIVAAVQFVEYLFHILHVITHDTPFNQMVQSIEKELMVVGFTAFIFKIIVNTTAFLELEWFHSLEYADILVPIFSFAYCGLGMMLILNSIRISHLWSQAYHHKLTEMLDTYFDLSGFTGYLPYGVWVAPFIPTVALLEFRIFHNIFCDTYKIQKNAFAFNEYVEKVFEKYILAIIEIRPVDWLLLCVLALLNWARQALRWDYQGCEGHPDHHCEDENARVMFTVAGAIILLMTLLLAVESRRLEVCIMAQKGIHSVHAYPAYLKYMEESRVASSLEGFRLNVSELKKSAEEVKYATLQKELHPAIPLWDKTRRTQQLLQKLKKSFPTFAAAATAPEELDQPAAAAPSTKNRKRGSVSSNKFGASVKQAWVSKKNISKRNRPQSIVAGAAQSTARISNSLRSSFLNISSAIFAEPAPAGPGTSGAESLGTDLDTGSGKSGKVYNLRASFGGNNSSIYANPPRQSPVVGAGRKVVVMNDTIHEHEREDEGGDVNYSFNGDSFNENDNETASFSHAAAGCEPVAATDVPLTLSAKRPRFDSDEQDNNSTHSTHSNTNALTNVPLRVTTTTNITTNTDVNDAPTPTSIGLSERVPPQRTSGDSFASTKLDTIGNAPFMPAEPRRQKPQRRTPSPFFEANTSAKTSARGQAGGTHTNSSVENDSFQGDHVVHTNAGWEDEESAIADVFFLSWPELYLEGVQSLIMIIALYYSMYFTHFVASSGSVAWKLFTLAPAVISSVLLVFIVKCAVLLSALHAVDCDAILEVLEQTEGAKSLSALIQEKIITRLQEMGSEPQAQLFDLFVQIDVNGNGCISRDEFAVFMNSIEIHSDRRRWMQVFRGIDKDFDRNISFEEFFIFLFPNHTIGLALQKKKERILEARVQQKADNRQEVLKKYRFSGSHSHAATDFVPTVSGSERIQAEAETSAYRYR